MMKKNKDYPIYWGYYDGWRFVQVRSIGYKWVWLRHGPFDPKYARAFRKIRRSEWDKGKFISKEEHLWQSEVKNWACGEIHQKYDADGKPCGASIINNMYWEPNKKYKWGRRLRSFEELETMYIEYLDQKKTVEVAA